MFSTYTGGMAVNVVNELTLPSVVISDSAPKNISRMIPAQKVTQKIVRHDPEKKIINTRQKKSNTRQFFFSFVPLILVVIFGIYIILQKIFVQ